MRSQQQINRNDLTLAAFFLFSVTIHCCIGFSSVVVHHHYRHDSGSTRITQHQPLYVSSMSRSCDQAQQQQQQHDEDLPFRSTMAGDPLAFAPFWDWHASFLEDNLPGLRAVDCSSNHDGDSFAYAENSRARIYNKCFESDDFRKIRVSYYDAGQRCQVFNALWYPRNGAHLPVLGVDLLVFGGAGDKKKRYLAIADFQPVSGSNNNSSRQYEQDVMAPIRQKYTALQGKMTTRFYDETQYFSNEMLYGRFEDDDTDAVAQIFPAFTEYVAAYTQLITQQHPPSLSRLPLLQQETLQRQAAYDSYSANRDPAKKMFENVFGKEWAEEFVHGFLFSLSTPPTLENDTDSSSTSASEDAARHVHHRQVAGMPKLRVEGGVASVLMNPNQY